MKHLHLLIPGLFPPQDIAPEVCAGLHLPALGRLLARGRKQAFPAKRLEDWLCDSFGVHSVAPARAASDGLDASEGYWLCADPVYLQVQHAQVLLLPEVVPGQDEAAALCAMLNAHFSGMGMVFHAPHPNRWYLQLEAEPAMATVPLREVAWRDAKFHQPQGGDALRWQAAVNEAQMLLHDHPLNKALEGRGGLAINSLWLWGGGHAEKVARAFDAVGGDSELAGAFARTAGISRTKSLRDMLDGAGERGLWACEDLSAAQQRGDYFLWRERVQKIEQECTLLLHSLQVGRLQRLTLEVLQENASHSFDLNRISAWKLWLAPRPFIRYAV